MLKKIVLAIALTLSVASVVGSAAPDGPFPDCYPCDGSGN